MLYLFLLKLHWSWCSMSHLFFTAFLRPLQLLHLQFFMTNVGHATVFTTIFHQNLRGADEFKTKYQIKKQTKMRWKWQTQIVLFFDDGCMCDPQMPQIVVIMGYLNVFVIKFERLCKCLLPSQVFNSKWFFSPYENSNFNELDVWSSLSYGTRNVALSCGGSNNCFVRCNPKWTKNDNFPRRLLLYSHYLAIH